MHSITIVGLIVLFSAYFLFIFMYLRKKRSIKSLAGSIFFKDRNLYGMVLELFLFTGFALVVWHIYMETDSAELSVIARISPFAALFFLQTLSRGVEEWRMHREEKRFWYEWSASLTILSAFVLLMIMEG